MTKNINLCKEYLITHGMETQCKKAVTLSGYKVALLFGKRVLLIRPYTSIIQDSVQFQQEMQTLTATNSGFAVSNNTSTIIVGEKNVKESYSLMNVVNEQLKKNLQDTKVIKKIYFRNTNILATIYYNGVTSFAFVIQTQNQIKPKIIKLDEHVNFTKIDEEGLFFGKRLYNVVDQNKINLLNPQFQINKIIHQQLGKQETNQFQEVGVWKISDDTLICAWNRNVTVIKCNSLICFPNGTLKSSKLFNKFVFFNQKSRILGVLFCDPDDNSFVLKLINCESRQIFQRVPLFFCRSVDSISFDHSLFVEVRKCNKSPKSIILNMNALYQKKKCVMYVFCNSGLLNRFGEGLIRRIFKVSDI